jgi:hypothetical protein
MHSVLVTAAVEGHKAWRAWRWKSGALVEAAQDGQLVQSATQARSRGSTQLPAASRRSARSRRRAVQSGVALAVAGVGGRGHLGSPSLLGQAAASVARHLGVLVSQHLAQRSPTRIVSTSVIAVLLPLRPSANDAQACGACQRF